MTSLPEAVTSASIMNDGFAFPQLGARVSVCVCVYIYIDRERSAELFSFFLSFSLSPTHPAGLGCVAAYARE